MMRRDYILRMIEEFFQLLSRLNAQKRGQLWQQAAGSIDAEFQRLVGAGAAAVVKLSETELLAKVIQGEPTQAVREKTLMVTTLLKEAGDVAAGQDRSEESRAYYLKGLDLLLGTLASGDLLVCPEFVPKVEVFLSALGDWPLPVPTQGLLMQHFERVGEFGRAEDALFAIRDAEPDNPVVAEFGSAFYRRLAGQSDAALAAGNLPRPELEAGLAEWRKKRG